MPTPNPAPRRRRVWAGAVASLVLIVAALVGVKALQIKAMIDMGKTFVPPPEAVSTARVLATTWQPFQSAIGTVVAVHGGAVGAELTGTIREIGFDSGSAVRRGALLVHLDTSIEEAQLAAAQADAALARSTLERAESLRQGGANTPADLDAARARALQTAAAVAGLEATIAKKTIRAPFDGRIAIRQVELGQVVSPGTQIASIQSVDPIYAEFALPQQSLAHLALGQRAELTTDAFPGETWSGKVATVNTEVDPATRNVRIRASIRNPDGRLRPGMFATVKVLAGAPRQVLVLPATAPIFAPYGDSVFVVEEAAPSPPAGGATGAAPPRRLTVRQVFVRLGERRGDLVEVTSGLAAGQTVVGSGAFKLRNGVAVTVQNDLAPDAVESPHPADE